MKKKWIVISIVIFVLILIMFCFIPICWKISHTMTVQLVDNIGDGVAVETEILLDGEYSFYLFRPDFFKGSIEMPAFPETVGKSAEIRIQKGTPDTLVYRSWQGSKLHSEAFGMVQASFGMKQMIICKSDEDGGINLDGDQTCVILVGDTTLENARELLEDLKHKD